MPKIRIKNDVGTVILGGVVIYIKSQQQISTTMSYENNDESSTCPICLEPLMLHGISASTLIGTAVPCGHCLHVHCWDQWTAATLNQQQRLSSSSKVKNTKCPLCNVPTSSFVRLFLNVPNNVNNSIDDDDSIFNSDEEDKAEYDSNDDGPIHAKKCKTDVTSKQDGSSSVRSTLDDCNNSKSKNYLNHKSIIKIRKIQYENKMLQTRYQETKDQCQQLQCKVQKYEEESQTVQLQLDRLTQLQHSNQLSLDDIAYKMTQVKRDHQNLEAKVKEAENLLKQKDSLLQQLKHQYEQKMKNMQKQQENMKEVQVILQERPRLVEEIRSLKDTVRQLRQQQLSLPPGACSGNISSAINMRAESSASKIQGADHATHKQRKRMLRAVSEQIEEAEDSTSFRQQRIIHQQRGTGNVKHEYVSNMSVNENHNNMKKATYAAAAAAAEGKVVLQSKKVPPFFNGKCFENDNPIQNMSKRDVTVTSTTAVNRRPSLKTLSSTRKTYPGNGTRENFLQEISCAPTTIRAKLHHQPKNIPPTPMDTSTTTHIPITTNRKQQATLLRFSKHHDKP